MAFLYSIMHSVFLFQPSPSGGGQAAPTGAPVGASGGCATQAGLLAVMMLVFYFLLIRPQQKRQKEHDQMLKSLSKGTVVRTSGGIRGEIFEINDRDATLVVADRVKINVLRSNIAGPDVQPQSDASGKTSDKSEGKAA